MFMISLTIVLLGKALTHKMEGKHHHISGEMVRKFELLKIAFSRTTS